MKYMTERIKINHENVFFKILLLFVYICVSVSQVHFNTQKVQKRTLDLLELSNVGAGSQTQVLSEVEMPLLQPPKKVFLNDGPR